MNKLIKQNKEVITNPYLDARREWNERYGSYIKQAHNWRLSAFVLLGILIIAVSGLVMIGSQNKMVPYIIEVDKLGNINPVIVAEQIRHEDPRVIRAMISQFIINIRSVLVDSEAQGQILSHAYSMLSQQYPSTTMINEYFQKGKSPFRRSKEETVTIEISSVLPISKKTWQIEWRETIRDRTGREKETFRMKAVATITIIPPNDSEHIMKNPIGLFIKNLSWSKQI